MEISEVSRCLRVGLCAKPARPVNRVLGELRARLREGPPCNIVQPLTVPAILRPVEIPSPPIL
jgi:hypothetical protein